jgi:hypothetical protein
LDTLADFLNRSIELLVGRESGPLHMRLVIQPTIATIIAIKAGLRDARLGSPPFLWTFLTDASERRRLVQSGWKDIGKVFTIAFLVDVAYQLFVFRWFYPLQSLSVAVIVAVVPYVALRGIVTRVARRTQKNSSSSARAA